MSAWVKGPNGYVGKVEVPTPAATKAALEGNEAFRDQDALDADGNSTGAPEQVPAAMTFGLTVSFALLQAYERRHHADLRGVDLNGRLDRFAQLVVTNAPEYGEIVAAVLVGETVSA